MYSAPKVSIIVPVYNGEKYLEKCLDSLINQTLDDIEIICVNDGSKDNSADILKKYFDKDKRIKIITKENEGLSAARNDGLKVASGEYIGYVDSDDWVDVDFYKKLYCAAIKYNSEIACANIMRTGKNIEKPKLKYDKENFYTDNKSKLNAADVPFQNYVWNKIYNRKSLINTNIQFIKGKAYEDIPWSIQVISRLKGLVTVPNVNYYYRRTKSSIRSSKRKQNYLDCIEMEKIMINFAKENNFEELLQNYKMAKRDRIKLFNINILKTFYYYPNTKKHYLFGIIPIGKTENKK